MEKYYYY